MIVGLAAQQSVGGSVESAELNLTDGIDVEGNSAIVYSLYKKFFIMNIYNFNLL